MQYQLKNKQTGQLSWSVFATKKEAHAAARVNRKMGRKIEIVRKGGFELATRAPMEDGMSRMVRAWNAKTL